jgi:septum site-determining protein MinC
MDFNSIKQILVHNHLVPVGIRGGTDAQHQAAVTVGIPLITIGSGSTSKAAPKSDSAALAAKRMAASKQQIPPRLITTPVRSGMSVYAQGTDLIVVAPVSVGAELMADGNIHIYGPLRGRALAGVQGNTQARIFCRTMEAELVAIAGYYLVKEDMHDLPGKESVVQVFLEQEQVKIAAV